MKTQIIKGLKSLKKNVLFSLIVIMVSFLAITSGETADKLIKINVDGAEIIRFDGDVSEVFIANPDIADVQLSNQHSAYLFGKSAGTTKLFAVNEKGKEILKADVVVTYNLIQLKELIAAYDPHGLVETKSVPGGILLEGQVDSPRIAEDIRSLTEKYLKKAQNSDQSVINRLTIKPPVQVQLRVKVAEVARGVLNEFGINWQDVIANWGKFKFGMLGNRAPFTALPIATNDVSTIFQPTTTVLGQQVNASTIGFGYVNSKVNLNEAIDLLAQDNLVTILAEPNLVAVSGETASFLAGGEFPYPVPQQLGNITIEFKQYGVSLAFTPTVLDGGLITMRVRPEVSELDPSTGIAVSGQTVPGILTRRAETTIQLGSGESFAIAGLLKDTVKSQIAGLPGLADLPVLGALFRSNSFQRGESELVIIVTPYLVDPSSGKEMLAPTDGLNYATFVEQIFERRLIKEGVQKGQAPAFGPGGPRLMGPGGFSIE